MNFLRPMRRPLLLAVAALALTVGCAQGETADTATTLAATATAPATTATTATTVGATTATTVGAAGGSTTTARTGGLTKEAAAANLKETFGFDLTTEQAVCITAKVIADDDLHASLEADAKPTGAQTAKLFEALNTCMGGPKLMAKAMVAELVSQGEFTAAQAPCLEEVFASMPPADMGKLADNDTSVMTKYAVPLSKCMQTK